MRRTASGGAIAGTLRRRLRPTVAGVPGRAPAALWVALAGATSAALLGDPVHPAAAASLLVLVPALAWRLPDGAPARRARRWSGIVLLVALAAALGGELDGRSAAWLGCWWIAALPVLLLPGRRAPARRVLVLGAGVLGQAYLERCRHEGADAVRVLGVFDDRRTRLPAPSAGVPVLGDLEAMLRFARRHPVDRIVVALPWTAEARLLDCLRRLRGVPAELRLCVDVSGVLRKPEELDAILVEERAMPAGEALLKSLLDRLLAALLLVLTAPLLVLVAAAVRAGSPGPVLYRQKRHGLGGEVFELLKFRTMRHESCEPEGAAAPPQARRGDPRVTPLGRWLRRTSIDELPQLVNVLRGEMSLVGPRPHALAHDHHFAALLDGYEARQRVRPGLTGWAQVNGLRGETETLEKMRRRVEHDLWYIRNRSLALDLRILVRTLVRGFGDPGAY